MSASPPLSSIDQLTHATVRLEAVTPTGALSTGTGFFFQFQYDGGLLIPAIITNKHVVEGADRIRAALTSRDASGGPAVGQYETFEFLDLHNTVVPHPDPVVDLCVMCTWPYLQGMAQSGKQPFFVSLDASIIPSPAEFQAFSALEEILMIGYPIGIWDDANNMPILRRGITATHPGLNFRGNQEFVIDAACFPGSSGSPVFIYNAGGWFGNGGLNVGSDRVKLLGLLWGGPIHQANGDVTVVNIPTAQRVMSSSPIPTNLGYVVRSNRILEMAAHLKSTLQSRGQL